MKGHEGEVNCVDILKKINIAFQAPAITLKKCGN